MRSLEKIRIENFKSIRAQELALRRLNVFIGANGAGKSNLIQVFQFLREIVDRNLAGYSLKHGAESLLRFGPKTSKSIDFFLEFGEGDSSNAYRLWLSPTNEGSLAVRYETVRFHDRGRHKEPMHERVISYGSKEAEVATSTDPIAAYVHRDLRTYRLYHFHDTSDSAAVKGDVSVDDNRDLRADASNLSAFLFLLQRQHPDHFRNIEDAVRQIAPFFDRFNLEPRRLAPDRIRLEWREKGSDAYFNATALSDGTLRFMCLATLLLQPVLPAIILIDEPELGLHPAAVSLLADLLISASTRAQVLVATQSVTLVNQFEPEHVWTVDREGAESVFRHLGARELAVWLEKYGDRDGYGLGEMWEKNLIGARP